MQTLSNDMISVSVIVPLYYGNRYIKQIIENYNETKIVLKNGIKESEAELILVNDSPEEKVIFEEQNNKDITLISHSVNMGIQQARISGIKKARGNFILLLDQDDYVDSDFLLSHIRAIKDNDVVVANGYRDFGDRKKVFYKNKLASILICNYKTYLYGTDMIFSPGQCLIRKTSIPMEWEHNILKNNGCDDFFLWLLMLKKGCRFVSNFNTFYYHRETSNNFSGSCEKMNNSFAEMIEQLTIKSFLPKKDIKVLKFRLEIKREKKKSLIKVLTLLMKKPRILIYTVLYKLSGYH